MPYIDPYLVERLETANETFTEANALVLRIWLERIVFSWQWWVNAALALLPWVVWFIIRDKRNAHRLIYAGLASLIISSFLDTCGMALGLWGYYIKVIPIIPPYFPWDFSVIPVAVMIMCQTLPRLHPLIKAAIFAAMGALVALPLSVWLGFIYLGNWQALYSFPSLFGTFMLSYFFYTRTSLKVVR